MDLFRICPIKLLLHFPMKDRIIVQFSSFDLLLFTFTRNKSCLLCLCHPCLLSCKDMATASGFSIRPFSHPHMSTSTFLTPYYFSRLLSSGSIFIRSHSQTNSLLYREIFQGKGSQAFRSIPFLTEKETNKLLKGFNCSQLESIGDRSTPMLFIASQPTSTRIHLKIATFKSKRCLF